MSWNRSYRNKTITVKNKLGQAVLSKTGRPMTRPAMFKTKEAETWQGDIQMLVQAARPTGFSPSEIIIAYDFVLARDIDCDNVMKMANDAIARAIGLNDRYFYSLPLSKVSGSSDPHIMIHIYDRSMWRIEIVKAGV